MVIRAINIYLVVTTKVSCRHGDIPSTRIHYDGRGFSDDTVLSKTADSLSFIYIVCEPHDNGNDDL